jgi:hypothetical protein
MKGSIAYYPPLGAQVGDDVIISLDERIGLLETINTDSSYTHRQYEPSTIWICTHGLNAYPKATLVLDKEGMELIVGKEHVSSSGIPDKIDITIIRFRMPQSGVAFFKL